MSMSFKILTLNDSEEWNNLLAKLPAEQQDIYYTPEYYSLYQNYGDGKAMCFVFEKDGGIALYPFLINSVNALGYDLDKEYFDIQGAYGYNGVVSSSYDPSFIKEYFSEFNCFCADNNIIADFSRFHPLIKNHLFSINYSNIVFDRNTIYVELNNSYEEISANYQRTTRKQIRRAKEKYNITTQRLGKEFSKEFYKLYKEAMQNVNAIDYLFFNEAYFNDLLALNNCDCFVAIMDGKIISAITTLKHNKYLHGHLGGTLQDFNKLSPFSLLYDEIIKYGKEQECDYIHFGGGATPKEDDPVLLFKKHFSDKIGEFHIGKKVHNSDVYNETVRIWERKYPEKTEKYKNYLLKYRY